MAVGMKLLDSLSPIRRGRKSNTLSVQEAMTEIVRDHNRSSSKMANGRGSSDFIGDDSLGKT
jgi:hypothetical protein